VEEMYTGLNLMTVAERETLYLCREVCNALEAAEFLQVLGYPTEYEAIKLLRNGKIRNIPYSVDDIRHLCNKYG
jgi:hypothetical protein